MARPPCRGAPRLRAAEGVEPVRGAGSRRADDGSDEPFLHELTAVEGDELRVSGRGAAGIAGPCGAWCRYPVPRSPSTGRPGLTHQRRCLRSRRSPAERNRRSARPGPASPVGPHPRPVWAGPPAACPCRRWCCPAVRSRESRPPDAPCRCRSVIEESSRGATASFPVTDRWICPVPGESSVPITRWMPKTAMIPIKAITADRRAIFTILRRREGTPPG